MEKRGVPLLFDRVHRAHFCIFSKNSRNVSGVCSDRPAPHRRFVPTRLPRGPLRAGSACRGTCVQVQPAAGRARGLSLPPRVHRYPIALRFPYYTESGHQNQHICLIFSNMCSILEPRALERRQIAAKLADRQSVHAGFGEDPGFCYHAGLPLLLEYKKLCPIIRTVPKFFPGVSSGTLGRKKPKRFAVFPSFPGLRADFKGAMPP